MIDFLAQNIIILEEKDLEKADIFIKFSGKISHRARKITKKALKLFKKT